ncbi:uncharacterized protein LOC117908316 [Vitis riparia]|uniref:uncharacterized protein LOC117908316 n=1 Tax=Vitis riparia TaxID=96939 RepID=UPI00155A62E5|nr:uncharacterized protein LOC117908316 [Vitis riparia]
MSSSNMDETSEQTQGREIEPTARDRGKKDKSRDTMANIEARLAKVELAMADTREGVDLIEQGMEKGLEDLREQIQDLRVQVKGAKGKRAQVAHTHMEKVTKGKVNSMGKRKQHSKNRKRMGLLPSEASQEKEVKNILAERVTRRQGVPPMIEYLVRWKGLPKGQASWEHVDSLRRFWKHIERFQKEATTRTSTA